MNRGPEARPAELTRLVALDASSPRLSVAAGSPERVVARRDAPASRSSAAIMALLDACLEEAGLAPGELRGMVVLNGPGSFTGLRVGMALAMGLHQALSLPVATLSTFDALAAAAPQSAPGVVAAVAIGRGRWLLREFAPGRPRTALGEPLRAGEREVLERSRDRMVIGFGLERLDRPVWVSDPERATRTGLVEAPPLAAAALALAPHASWSPQALSRPLYLAPPPADPPRT
jgi:tRNA threonylcarbamoyl adenosine modification protein YeaZ